MNELKVLSHINKELAEQWKTNTTFLADGGAKSYDEYRHICGVIRGLAQAESLIKDLVQRLERNDD
tara:strand:- start:7585 stop:7782 length:198 start_codon:yes stop_codon:yes gene_type:complete